ncbi:MAG: hypothetical protein IKC15_05765 [Kiritimatiellae bacterium]|nr:hypothetical protein [Kiritimatiellia bacterium]
MNRPLIAMFACCAAIALASSAAARTVTVDSLAGTNATVTVGPGEATEYLGLAYGNTDGYANPGVGWDAIASLAAVPAAGGTYAVTLPFDPLTNATYRYSRFVLAEHPFDTRLDYLPGNGKTYFDTGITNASTDSVELAIRVSSYGSSYSGIFGARAGASEKNLSVFCSKDWEVYVDFNSSVANTYRASPGFPDPSGGSAHDVTIAISAAERHVDVFRDGAAVSPTRGASTNKTYCADEFICPGSAYIFKVNGQPASGWATAGSGYGFVSCRIDRGGETIADMVPVSLFVDGVRVGRIYDLVRGKFLDRGGELAEFDITGVPSVKTRVTASAAQGYESSSVSAITVTGIDGGYISVTVRAAAADLRLVLAYGASDAGNAIVDWDGVIAVAALEQGETKLKVPLPDGWGTSVNAFRLFAVSGYEAWIDSSGTQYIDTGWVNGNSNIVELSFQPLALSSNARAFYGCRNAAGSRNISMFVDGSCFYCDFNNGNYDTYRLKNVPRSTDYRYRMVNSAARRVAERLQDGAVVGTSSNTKACADVFTCAGSAYLFAANDMSGGSPAVLWSSNGLPPIRFHSLDVTTTDGAACCSIRPCKRGGVGEVFDSVRNRYFQNIGTGSFAFGCKGTALAVSDLITPQTQFHKGFMVIIY